MSLYVRVDVESSFGGLCIVSIWAKSSDCVIFIRGRHLFSLLSVKFDNMSSPIDASVRGGEAWPSSVIDTKVDHILFYFDVAVIALPVVDLLADKVSFETMAVVDDLDLVLFENIHKPVSVFRTSWFRFSLPFDQRICSFGVSSCMRRNCERLTLMSLV